MALSQLTDLQLKKLFTTTWSHELTPRGRNILNELIQRGYFFDARRSEFLTRKQWEARYREAPPAPADYGVYLQQYAKRHGADPSPSVLP